MEDRAELTINRTDYDLLDEVRKANGWSTKQAARRAVHAIWSLDQHLKQMEDRHEGDVGTLIGRLRRELDPWLLVHPKPMHKIEGEGDQPVRIRIDDFMFFELGGLLLASRILAFGNRTDYELYRVRDGQLLLLQAGAYSGAPGDEGLELT